MASKADRAILEEAKKRLTYAIEQWSPIYDEALSDLEFKNGDQWPDDIKAARAKKGQPCLTINRLPQFVKQVVGDQRQNRTAIKIQPVESNDKDAAEIREGIIRQIQNASAAEAAYDTAFESAVSCGIGFFRIAIEYASEDTFDQDITVHRINNPLSVFIDPTFQQSDASDIDFAFVAQWLSRDAFEARYPKKKPSSFSDVDQYSDLANDSDNVMIVEYWRRVKTKRSLLLLSDGSVIEADLFTEERAEAMLEDGVQVVAERVVDSHRVESYTLSADDVLESITDYPGRNIPIVAVFGEEDNVAGQRILRSLIRFAKDPQRMYNYWRTAATEMVALGKSAPWLVTPEQIEGFESQWSNANNGSSAFLYYNATAAGRPTRDSGPSVPSAFLTESRETAEEMKSTIGIFNAGLGDQSNETSGRAILARQRESDTATFAFIDNLARAIRFAGKIMIDLIPHVYSNERIIRVLGNDDSERVVKINQEIPGSGARIYDMTVGKYDVVVSTGPSYATQRTEAANSMMSFVQAVPQAATLVSDLIAKNMDWPGSDEIADRLKTMLPDQLKEPEEGEPQLPPEVAQDLQQMQQAMQQMHAQLQQAHAALSEKDMDERKLNIDAYKAETERLKLLQPAMTADEINELVMQAVTTALSNNLTAGQEQPIMQEAEPSGLDGMNRGDAQ